MLPTIATGNVASGLATGYDVANSCIFQDSGSDEMSRAIASTGSNTTWTVSAWVKRVELGQSSPIFGTGDGGANNDARMVFFDAADAIECSYYNSGYTYEVTTNRLFRDLSSWYHICILFDTTESTAADRIKIYVNGVKETSFATSSYPSEDAAFNFGNTSYTHYVNDMGGRNIRGSHYIAELVYIDGTASAVTNFGEFNSDSPNIWQPVDVSGLSVGTNGVYLDFEASDNLGNAVDGGTDFTEAGLAAGNQSTDSPTNNFCVFMSNTTSSYTNLTEGGLILTGNSASDSGNSLASIGITNGKWYFELEWDNIVSGYGVFGMLDTTDDEFGLQNLNGGGGYPPPNIYGISVGGNMYDGSSADDGWAADYSNGDVLGFAFDMDNGAWYLHLNGTYYTSGDPTSGASKTGAVSTWTADGRTFAAWEGAYNGSITKFNFGNPPFTISSGNADGNGYGNFEYAVPSGYYSICTKNLAEVG